MRQRKAKNLKEKLERCSEYIIEAPCPEACRTCFDGEGPLFLEIGCGKGSFIIKKALENPDRNYIAVEGQETVLLRALEKAMEVPGGIPNLKFMMTFIHSMDEFFEEGQLDGIYLNFSDPWPKARHAKRRLTWRGRLMDYKWALKPGGFIEFKSDNDQLYEFTMDEIEAAGLDVAEKTTDLHSSSYESRLTTTEYEEKFRSRGKNINYVKVVV
ncbi:MAG: tRNA (guanosine(46)-N7)-methyltransferase TrmB [Bacillota bacterium]|nr:tRNA (guanosine(46)-N7)-methyltransferase TrmB [Bacillota bacterium]